MSDRRIVVSCKPRKGVQRQLAVCLLCFLPVIFSEAANAVTLIELQQANKLSIRSWIEPGENIIAHQQVSLQIEIATDTRFSGGTKISAFNVQDAIVLQREKFAVNSTRSLAGKNWAVQQWTLVIYPQRQGLFEIPQISLHLSIAGEATAGEGPERIIGILQSESLSFVAGIPEAMLDKTNWMATTRFEVEESFDKTFDDLIPGDAIIRSVRLSADDLPAMMLPNIVADNIQGMAVYAKPPRLVDKVNRGAYLAERVQVVTYVFEKPGEYQIPQQTFYWWNLNSQTIESIEVGSQTITVKSLAGIDADELDSQQRKAQPSPGELVSPLKVSLAILFVIIIGYVVWKLGSNLPTLKSNQPPKMTETNLRRQFEAACRQNNLEHALRLFYQWLDNYGGKAFAGSIRERLTEINQAHLTVAFNNIMQTIYTPDQDKEVDLKLFGNQFIHELRQFDRVSRIAPLGVDLRLN